MNRSALLLLVPLFFACNDPSMYNESSSIEEGFWLYDDAVVFNIPVEDTSSLFIMDLDLNHSPDFAYQNLYLKIQSQFPDGQLVDDVISLELGDKVGRWIGNCSSSTCRASFQIRNNFNFSQLGNHRIRVSQHSRIDSLEGISKLGLRVYTAE